MRFSPKSLLLGVVLAVALLYTTAQTFAAGGASVDVVNFAYNPSPVTVQVGDTVTWTNSEGNHSVTADPGQDETFNQPSGTGWTFTHTFTTPGTYEYYCTIHSSPDGTFMNGVVVVEDAPTAVTLGTLTSGSNMGWTFALIGAGILLVGGLGVVVAVRSRQ